MYCALLINPYISKFVLTSFLFLMEESINFLAHVFIDGTFRDLTRRALVRLLQRTAELLYPGISCYHFYDIIPLHGALAQPMLDIFMTQEDIPNAIISGLTAVLSHLSVIGSLSVAHGVRSRHILRDILHCLISLIRKLRMAKQDENYWVIQRIGNSFLAKQLRLLLTGSLEEPDEKVVLDHQSSLSTREMIFLELLQQTPQSIAECVQIIRRYHYYRAETSHLVFSAAIVCAEKLLYIAGLFIGGKLYSNNTSGRALYDRAHDIAYVCYNVGVLLWSVSLRSFLQSFFADDRVAPHELIGEEFFLQQASSLSFDEVKKMIDAVEKQKLHEGRSRVAVYIQEKRIVYSTETMQYLLKKLMHRIVSRRSWIRAMFRPTLVKPEDAGKDACCICLETYKENETVIRLSCGHRFHDGELIEWLEKNAECPMCRRGTLVRFLSLRKTLAHMILVAPSIFQVFRIRRADSLLFPKFFMFLLM